MLNYEMLSCDLASGDHWALALRRTGCKNLPPCPIGPKRQIIAGRCLWEMDLRCMCSYAYRTQG